ncbi:MAG TPA: cation-transporting P-type ATPase [bacterium]|nr:cation-transporting P-type ATPase [bacterium]
MAVNNHIRGIAGNEVPRKMVMSIFDAARSTVDELLSAYQTRLAGLSFHEARQRLEHYGPNEPSRPRRHTAIFQFLVKFLNPLVIVLIIIAVASLFFGKSQCPHCYFDGPVECYPCVHSGIPGRQGGGTIKRDDPRHCDRISPGKDQRY